MGLVRPEMGGTSRDRLRLQKLQWVDFTRARGVCGARELDGAIFRAVSSRGAAANSI